MSLFLIRHLFSRFFISVCESLFLNPFFRFSSSSQFCSSSSSSPPFSAFFSLLPHPRPLSVLLSRVTSVSIIERRAQELPFPPSVNLMKQMEIKAPLCLCVRPFQNIWFLLVVLRVVLYFIVFDFHRLKIRIDWIGTANTRQHNNSLLAWCVHAAVNDTYKCWRKCLWKSPQ